jgi:hypothetical protein
METVWCGRFSLVRTILFVEAFRQIILKSEALERVIPVRTGGEANDEASDEASGWSQATSKSRQV